MEKIKLEQLELNPFEVIGSDNFLLTAGDNSIFNTMTAGWGGFGYLWSRPVVFVFVRESRYTKEFMERFDGFSISFFSKDYKNILGFCGTHTGRDTNKVEECNITPVSVDGTIAFEEANLVLSCKKISKVFLDKSTILDPDCLTHYPQGDYHYMYVGEIEGVYIN